MMKIFSAQQVREWDAYTIAHEPVLSDALMERAATACYGWIAAQHSNNQHYRIFCGKGNNGGDGLAIARLLLQNNFTATVYIAESGKPGSADFQLNLQRLHAFTSDIHFIQSPDFFPAIGSNDIVIDALVGTGLKSGLNELMSALVNHINQSKATVIAIDLPTGLMADAASKNQVVINAGFTLSFQNYKLALLVAENESFIGEVHLLDIGLDQTFESTTTAGFELVEKDLIKSIYRPRKQFSHKGTFGHAALLTGSYGMMGAAVLSARACARSGVGKLTCYIPEQGYNIMQVSLPEAICKLNDEQISASDINQYQACGIGPGWGITVPNTKLLEQIFAETQLPLLLDADALTILSNNELLLNKIPKSTIITPHPKEFDRLFCTSANDFDRIQLAVEKSKTHHIYIVLKGHYTVITTPYGKAYFNSTGNAGMAKGGSGDVLTGLLTGLLAQGYEPSEACLLGVYLHGLSGDFAAATKSMEAMMAGDLVDFLSEAFLDIGNKKAPGN